MANSMKNVLIFGINGFVGGYLARELHQNGWRIMGTDRGDTCKVTEATDYRALDITNACSVLQAIDELHPDAIVNLAAISSVGTSWAIPQQTIATNVLGAINIFEAVKETDRNIKILLIGSSEEYAPSTEPLDETSALSALSPYGISKATQGQFADLYAERFSLDITRTRSFNHTGIGQTDTFVLPSFCKQVAQIASAGKPGVIEVGNIDVVRDFSDVHDIARAYRLLLEGDYSGEVFNVGSGIGYSLRELLDHIISLADVEITVSVAKDRIRPADNPIIICNYNKLHATTGWKPGYGVKHVLREMFSYSLEKYR